MFVSKVNFCQFNTEIVWMLEIIVNKTKKAHAYVQREGFMAIFKNVAHYRQWYFPFTGMPGTKVPAGAQ